jgi:hypothetical protein
LKTQTPATRMAGASKNSWGVVTRKTRNASQIVDTDQIGPTAGAVKIEQRVGLSGSRIPLNRGF